MDLATVASLKAALMENIILAFMQLAVGVFPQEGEVLHYQQMLHWSTSIFLLVLLQILLGDPKTDNYFLSSINKKKNIFSFCCCYDLLVIG